MATNARQFDGAGDKVTCSLGSAATFGPTTIAAVIKVDELTTNKCIISAGTSDPNAYTFLAMSDESLGLWQGSTATFSATGRFTTGIWYLVAVSKATGSATPKFHIYNYSTPGWVHENGGATASNSGAAVTSLWLGIGNGGAGDDFAGAIQAVGFWTSALSDGNIETLVAGRQAWRDLSPAALWTLDQPTTTFAVQDEIGTADQSALTGTTVVTGNPNWNAGIGPPVAIGTVADASSTSPYSLTTTGAVPSGSRIFVVCQWAQPTPTLGAVTVSGGGLSWEQDHHQEEVQGSANRAFDIWSADCPSGLASSTALSIALTIGSGRWGMDAAALHCSGIAAASRTDGATDQIMAATTAWDAEALTTTNATDLLIVGALGDGPSSAGNSIDSPWVELADWYDSGNAWADLVGYRIVSSTSTYAAGGDWVSASTFGGMSCIAAYKAEGVAAWPPAGSENAPQTIRPYLTARLR